MIKLNQILLNVINEGGKLFGSRAQRVTTGEMNAIFEELKKRLGSGFTRFKLSKALPSKETHGDIDIVISGNPNVKHALTMYLGPLIKDYSKNGNIYSVLFSSQVVDKTVHVDFIYATDEDYEAQYDYLSYNDFSGILGVITRKLNFSYGTNGFFKIYNDKSKKNNYILITKSLRDGLRILGYGDILNKFDTIQNIDDVVRFISYSDLFDSDYLKSDGGLNRSDRKRMRSNRQSAVEIRDKLIALNKRRTQMDDNYYFKKLFPDKYEELLIKQNEIDNKTILKSKYGGEYIMKNFPNIKPGPVLGNIKQHLHSLYGDKLDNQSPDDVNKAINSFINKV